MPYSAAESHHMVSELRLLMSSLQDDPMGEVFNPNLPPIFDVYDEEVPASLGRFCLFDHALPLLEFQSVIFDPNLPPRFDIYPEEADYYFRHVLPPCFDGNEGSLFVEEMMKANQRGPYGALINRKSKIKCGSSYFYTPVQLTDLPKIDTAKACGYFDLCFKNPSTFTVVIMGNIKSLMAEAKCSVLIFMNIELHNEISEVWVVRTKLVFDPGGFHSSKNRDDSF